MNTKLMIESALHFSNADLYGLFYGKRVAFFLDADLHRLVTDLGLVQKNFYETDRICQGFAFHRLNANGQEEILIKWHAPDKGVPFANSVSRATWTAQIMVAETRPSGSLRSTFLCASEDDGTPIITWRRTGMHRGAHIPVVFTGLPPDPSGGSDPGRICNPLTTRTELLEGGDEMLMTHELDVFKSIYEKSTRYSFEDTYEKYLPEEERLVIEKYRELASKNPVTAVEAELFESLCEILFRFDDAEKIAGVPIASEELQKILEDVRSEL